MRRIQEGINQDKIQEMNRTLLLNLIREQGECSRAQLSQLSGLNKATITYIVNDFIEADCVEETGLLTSGKGRRSIGISLSDKKYYVIGIRLARTYFKIGIFDLRGHMKECRRVKIQEESKADLVIHTMIKEIQRITGEQKERKLLMIGMAIPGPFIKGKGRIAVLTGTSGFEKIEFREELQKTFDTNIMIEQDANAGVFAQLWYDKDVHTDQPIVYVAAGEGIGAGILMNGNIIRGVVGTAGEIGHTSIDFNGIKCKCGNRGCLENYCSVLALKNNIEQKKGRKLSLDQIKEMIAEGDPEAVLEYRKACRFLAYGIVNVVNFYNPSIIIFGDELSHMDSKILLEEIDLSLKDRILPEIYQNLKIKMSEAVNDSVLHGIGAMCIEEVFSHYSSYF